MNIRAHNGFGYFGPIINSHIIPEMYTIKLNKVT